MDLKRFLILSDTDETLGPEEQPILLNLDHIISVKPIKMMVSGSQLNGYWIRTSNGKKYRATQIPQDLEETLGAVEKKSIKLSNESDIEQPLYQ